MVPKPNFTIWQETIVITIIFTDWKPIFWHSNFPSFVYPHP